MQKSVFNLNDFPMYDQFTFDPTNCDKRCIVDTDCMVQMVCVYNSAEMDFTYPNSGTMERATANGWFIDRLNGSAYGYYGLHNDGKTFDPYYNQPGSNGHPTTLFDDPGGWGNNTLFYAVDAAVSFRSKACNNRILGYYFWSFQETNGKPSEFINGTAWQTLNAEFQSAVGAWDAWAPFQGPQTETDGGRPVPGQPVTPNAYPFPTLVDL